MQRDAGDWRARGRWMIFEVERKEHDIYIYMTRKRYIYTYMDINRHVHARGVAGDGLLIFAGDFHLQTGDTHSCSACFHSKGDLCRLRDLLCIISNRM